MTNTIGIERTERIEQIIELVYLQTESYRLKREINKVKSGSFVIEHAAGVTIQIIINVAKELQEIVDTIKSEEKIN